MPPCSRNEEKDSLILPHHEIIFEDVLDSHRHYIVERFVESQSHLADQGSAAWLKSRIKTIGGSEMAVIKGKNPYQTLSDLVINKITPGSFKSTVKTRWGNLFEDVIQAYSELIFDTEIYNTGSFKGKHGNSYSPDGIGVITINNTYTRNSIHFGKSYKSEKICLFEFKCPLTRVPTGSIPVYYKPQVLSGMDAIRITETSLFIEAIFRKCQLSDLKFNGNYNQDFHVQLSPKSHIPFEKPVALGALFLFLDKEKAKKRTNKISNICCHCAMVDFGKYSILDFGQASLNCFDSAMELTDNGTMQAFYMNPILEKDSDNVEKIINKRFTEFDTFCTKFDYEPFAIVPWKLVKIFTKQLQPEYGYVESSKSVIQETLDIIRRSMELETSEEKLNLVNKYFYEKQFNNTDILDDFMVDEIEKFLEQQDPSGLK